MRTVAALAELPNVPAVYSMLGGSGGRSYVAYVGIAEALKNRVTQHLVNRDSSVTTGIAAAGLRPDFVTEVRWWEHPDFSDRAHREAAELVAFDALDPALRSRGAVPQRASELLHDRKFVREMRKLFSGQPAGQLIVPSLETAMTRIGDLEGRMAQLEAQLRITRREGQRG